MSNFTNTTQLRPNPDTPLAFFQPAAAYQISVAIYFGVASLAVLIWDMLDNISDDFMLLFKIRIRTPTVIYFISRLASLGHALSADISQTAGTGNCINFQIITDAFYPISISCNALLFFFRLRAIYEQNRVITMGFFSLWLGVLASTILIPISVPGGYIGNTKYCLDTKVPNMAYAGTFMPLFYDTLVFMAISWRLAKNDYMGMNFQEGIRVAIFGKDLPTFTKSLLFDGQRYYLISLISNLVVVIMAFDKNVPVLLRSMGAISNVVITNIMACRVFRKTKLGQLPEESCLLQTSNNIVFKPDTQKEDRSHLDVESRPDHHPGCM